MHVLVLGDEGLLLFVDDADLVHEELGCRSLIILALLPSQSLVCLEEFPLRLVDYMLELLPVPLQLHLVTLCLLLEIKVLLQELVPPSLALALPLVHLFNYAPVFDVLRRQIFKQLSEDRLLLGTVTCVGDLLQRNLDVLLQVLDVTLFQVQVGRQLRVLPLEQ